jgi:hypothetical protein
MLYSVAHYAKSYESEEYDERCERNNNFTKVIFLLFKHIGITVGCYVFGAVLDALFADKFIWISKVAHFWLISRLVALEFLSIESHYRVNATC